MAKAATKEKPVVADTPPTGDGDCRRVTVERADLLRALASAVSVVAPRGTIPILSNLLIDVGGEHVTLVATNLDQQMAVTVDRADGGGESWSTTVPAARLHDLVRSWPDGAQVRMEQPVGARMRLTCGRFSARMAVLPASDFPVLAGDDAMIAMAAAPAKDFAAALSRVAFAASSEETRYYLNGVFAHAVDMDDGARRLRLVATDGVVAAWVDGPPIVGAGIWPGAPGSSENKDGAGAHIIIPRAVVALLQRQWAGVDAEAEWSLIDGGGSSQVPRLRARCGHAVLTTKLIDGSFPDYRRVFPPLADQPVNVAKADLDAAVASVMAMTSGKVRGVKVERDSDRLTISLTDPQHGEAKAELPAAASPGPATAGRSGLRGADRAVRSGDVRRHGQGARCARPAGAGRRCIGRNLCPDCRGAPPRSPQYRARLRG